MPWPNIPRLIQTDTVDIYRGVTGKDSGGGYNPSYPASPSMSGVTCSVQWDSIEEVAGEYERIEQYNLYTIIFDRMNPAIRPRDKILWTDSGGQIHTLFARSQTETTGEGATWVVPVQEKI